MRQCDAEHITHYSRSRVILCAIGCRHSPRIASENAMVIEFGVIIEFWRVKTLSGASVKKAQNRPSTQLIESMSCVESSNVKPKSSAIFLAMDKNW